MQILKANININVDEHLRVTNKPSSVTWDSGQHRSKLNVDETFKTSLLSLISEHLPVPSSYISGPKCKDAKQAPFKAVKLKENFWDLLRFCSLLTRWCTKVSKKQNWQCIANIWTDFYCFLHQAWTCLWIYLVNEVDLNELFLHNWRSFWHSKTDA